ncbi:MAG: nucleotidyl transferase AbiEii/AbiGii toxin family protein [Candidatus Levybacteria bacterium]|nr:nucleotidyl transferase AbiEii/AbiGii toxin family protein [Candidatus Levybacteria bacterium]
MVNIDLHRDTFIKILRAIYSDPLLRSNLGFKGGTAAMLFYKLPRFSVDLDFDLLDPEKKEEVFKKLGEILPQFGTVIEASNKHYTLFFLLSYKKGERGLKVEISKRIIKSAYEPKNFLGISMLVMKEEDMAAGKLAALLTRKRFATRDMFDLWFFLKENWQINEEFLKAKSGLSLKQALKKAQPLVKNVKPTELLAGLGDLLDPKQKAWVKEHLKEELLFQLKLYQSNI